MENSQTPTNGANTETPAASQEINQHAGGVEPPNNQAPNGAGNGVPRSPSPIAHGDHPTISTKALYALGISLIVLTIMVVYLLYGLWPENSATGCTDIKGQKIPCWANDGSVFNQPYTLAPEKRMILLVLLAGALGSLIHGTTSFSNYVGDGKLDQKWVWWYMMRPIIGMAVAMIFYLVFRGGLITASSVEVLNIFGILTLSALAGLFTDRATLKLSEVFETLFKPKDTRADKLETPSPTPAAAGAVTGKPVAGTV